jgi:hypothetical protein
MLPGRIAEVTISVADDALDDMSAVTQRLKNAGLEHVEVHKGLRTITGRIDEDRIAQLETIPGVGAVERSKRVGVPDPAAGLH